MNKSYDLIVLGGGCAGLSLAARLAVNRRIQGTENFWRAPRILVLESRLTYEQDRHWCFWELPDSLERDLITHRWSGVEICDTSKSGISGQQRKATVEAKQFPYSLIRSKDFYHAKLSLLRASENVDVAFGEAFHGPAVKMGGGWRVETPRGCYAARAIVDTRPPANAAKEQPLLWQCFLGVELRSETPVFRPERAVLMDFVDGSEGRILFTYLLPFSDCHALVEITEFSPTRKAPDALQADLHNAIQHYVAGTKFKILHREKGVIPMGGTRVPTYADPTYISAGLRGGAARPSTGYAFQRIQRWARDCAARWRRDGALLPPSEDPLWMRFMDGVFLEVLREHPDAASEIFYRLFAQAKAESVIRFLSDVANAGDIAAVVAALPKGLFIRQALTSCRTQALRWQESHVS